MDALTSQLTPLLDAGYIPSPLIRTGIRAQLRSRLATLPSPSTSLTAHYAHKMRYVERLRTQPIALHTDKANEQHYEVGTSVLEGMLGKRMKYSSCLYEVEGGKEPGQGGRLKGSLDEAEERMLDLYVQRAGIEDGMEILDLGYVFFLVLSFACFIVLKHAPSSHVDAFLTMSRSHGFTFPASKAYTSSMCTQR